MSLSPNPDGSGFLRQQQGKTPPPAPSAAYARRARELQEEALGGRYRPPALRTPPSISENSYDPNPAPSSATALRPPTSLTPLDESTLDNPTSASTAFPFPPSYRRARAGTLPSNVHLAAQQNYAAGTATAAGRLSLAVSQYANPISGENSLNSSPISTVPPTSLLTNGNGNVGGGPSALVRPGLRHAASAAPAPTSSLANNAGYASPIAPGVGTPNATSTPSPAGQNNPQQQGTTGERTSRLRSGSLTLPTGGLSDAFGPSIFSSSWLSSNAARGVDSSNGGGFAPLDELRSLHSGDSHDDYDVHVSTLDYLGLDDNDRGANGLIGGVGANQGVGNGVAPSGVVSGSLRGHLQPSQLPSLRTTGVGGVEGLRSATGSTAGLPPPQLSGAARHRANTLATSYRPTIRQVQSQRSSRIVIPESLTPDEEDDMMDYVTTPVDYRNDPLGVSSYQRQRLDSYDGVGIVNGNGGTSTPGSGYISSGGNSVDHQQGQASNVGGQNGGYVARGFSKNTADHLAISSAAAAARSRASSLGTTDEPGVRRRIAGITALDDVHAAPVSAGGYRVSSTAHVTDYGDVPIIQQPQHPHPHSHPSNNSNSISPSSHNTAASTSPSAAAAAANARLLQHQQRGQLQLQQLQQNLAIAKQSGNTAHIEVAQDLLANFKRSQQQEEIELMQNYQALLARSNAVSASSGGVGGSVNGGLSPSVRYPSGAMNPNLTASQASPVRGSHLGAPNHGSSGASGHPREGRAVSPKDPNAQGSGSSPIAQAQVQAQNQVGGGSQTSSSTPGVGPGALAQAQIQTPSRSLWIGNLDSSVSGEDLARAFAPYGAIESFRLLPEKECGFINFVDIADAIRAKDDVLNRLGGSIGQANGQTVRIGFGKADSAPATPSGPNSGGTHSSHFLNGGGGTARDGSRSASSATGGADGMEAQLQSSPTRALWIGSIPSTTTPATILSVFSPFGPIESARVLTHKNCGFVNFERLDDAVRARKALNGRDVLGSDVGAIRIGFARVPVKNGPAGQESEEGLPTSIQGVNDLSVGATIHALRSIKGASAVPADQQVLGGAVENYRSNLLLSMLGTDGYNPSATSGTLNQVGTASGITPVTEQQLIMKLLGDGANEPEVDLSSFSEFRPPMAYYTTIPVAAERTNSRRWDASKLRELRKRLDSGSCTIEEIDDVASDFLDGEIVDLASDWLGNTVVQKLFEKSSPGPRVAMLERVAPHLAMIGIHKNGTWAAQKVIECASTPDEITLIAINLRPYAPPLLLDQFGNYVVQCCLRFGYPANDFIFDAMTDRLWEIAQGRFGARSMRACLESPYVTMHQQRRIATAVILNSIPLATNPNGALLLTWLLDTSGFHNRYTLLAPRFTPHLSHLCTHKLASLTVLRIVNQKSEPAASQQIVQALFFSQNDHVLTDVLGDQINGVAVVHKVLQSPYLDPLQRPNYLEATKRVLIDLKVTTAQAYRRLIEEVGLPIPNFANSPATYGQPQPVPNGTSKKPNASPHSLYDAQPAAMNGGYESDNLERDMNGITNQMQQVNLQYMQRSPVPMRNVYGPPPMPPQTPVVPTPYSPGNDPYLPLRGSVDLSAQGPIHPQYARRVSGNGIPMNGSPQTYPQNLPLPVYGSPQMAPVGRLSVPNMDPQMMPQYGIPTPVHPGMYQAYMYQVYQQTQQQQLPQNPQNQQNQHPNMYQ